MYSRIRIPAKWYHPGDAITMPRDAHGVADFKLGLGICGKTVTRLGLELSAAGALIEQTTDDGEEKQFFYPIHTLTGRVEATIL